MGKRSNFERKPKDLYPTIDPTAAAKLAPHVSGEYIEPCAGDGALIRLLHPHGLTCTYACDIEPMADGIDKQDVLFFETRLPACKQIITNPVWEREPLHKMIDVFRRYAPTWLLFDAGWAYTKQAKPFLEYCHKIIPVGRLRWIEGTNMSGKDDCQWYFFKNEENTGFAEFITL